MKRELKAVGKSAFESIAEMVEALETQSEESRTAIEEDALSIEVRSDWHSPGERDCDQAAEYRILLSTGPQVGQPFASLAS